MCSQLSISISPPQFSNFLNLTHCMPIHQPKHLFSPFFSYLVLPPTQSARCGHTADLGSDLDTPLHARSAIASPPPDSVSAPCSKVKLYASSRIQFRHGLASLRRRNLGQLNLGQSPHAYTHTRLREHTCTEAVSHAFGV
jgi:hypothetical protein